MAISRAFGAEVHHGRRLPRERRARPRRARSAPSRATSRRSSSTTSGTSRRTATGWGRRSCASCRPAWCRTRSSAGVGTGGTIVGVGQAFRAVNPALPTSSRVEPNESCTLMCGEVGKHLIEGISDGFVPGIVARHGRSSTRSWRWTRSEAIGEMRRLAREFGLFVGPSSGAHLVAARSYGRPTGMRARRHVLLRRGREVHQRLLPGGVTPGTDRKRPGTVLAPGLVVRFGVSPAGFRPGRRTTCR